MNVSCSYLQECKVYVIKIPSYCACSRHYFFGGAGGLSLSFFRGGFVQTTSVTSRPHLGENKHPSGPVFSWGQKRCLPIYVRICRVRYSARREDVQMIEAQAHGICACVAHDARQLAATLIHAREPRAFSRRTSDLEQVFLHSNVPNVQENAWKQHTLWHQPEKKAAADTSRFPLQFLHFHFIY